MFMCDSENGYRTRRLIVDLNQKISNYYFLLTTSKITLATRSPADALHELVDHVLLN